MWDFLRFRKYRKDLLMILTTNMAAKIYTETLNEELLKENRDRLAEALSRARADAIILETENPEKAKWDDVVKARSANIKNEIMELNGKLEKFDIANEQIRKFEQRIQEAAFIYRNYASIVEETLKRIQ